MTDMGPIRSVLIVGGGTTGWMAAAALKQAMGPHAKVQLVESEEIGIVGVGEATVPPIRDFNVMIDLDEAEFMRETRASIKLGIEFVGWGKTDSRYFHPFGTYGPGPTLSDFHQSWLYLQSRGRALPLDAYSIGAQVAGRMRATLRDPDPRSPLNGVHTAYHFDAGLYARYLRKVCEGRGVERIEGKVVDVARDGDTGHVTTVTLADGRSLDADLFVDCSGFRALLIGGALGVGYEDWSHWLPMDRAWAVPCEIVGPTTPYTRSTAREAGWQWRIPLQHRTGNGLVYCSQFMDDANARETLLAHLDGPALAEPRPLRFTTGRRKTYWQGNVVCLGLASGFIEPLESTSIHLVQAGLTRLLQHFPDRSFSPVNIAAFNRRFGREVDLVRDFVILHYKATQSDDTAFWRWARDMAVPDTLAERMDAFRERGLLYAVEADEFFSPASWMSVMIGQGLIPQSFNPLYTLQNPDRGAVELQRVAQTFARAAMTCLPHDDFLKSQYMWAH